MKAEIRTATVADNADLREIYDYEVEHGTATFDTEGRDESACCKWILDHNQGNHPLIVAVLEGKVIGYASLSTFNAKAAYNGTVELSVYVHHDYRGRGIGRSLTHDIIELARKDERTHRIVSLITSENTASIGMHRSYGFDYAGCLHEVGYKFDRPLDVQFWELAV